jgi:hypothetical protein
VLLRGIPCPRKERPENEIDGIIALIMVRSRALMGNGSSSVYEERWLIDI